MKVIRITTSLNYGGVEKNFELHAKYHRADDYELIVVALENGGRAEEFIRERGIKVITLGLNARVPSIKCLVKLMAFFRDHKPDVVHTSCAEGNFHGLLAGWLTAVPVRVGEEIGIPSHSFLAKLIFSFIYRTAHRVIAISKAVAEFLTTYEAPRKKVELIYYPIDIESVHSKRTRTTDAFVLATVCRLEEVKNLPVLLDLLAVITKKYSDRSFELWFIGDGSQRDALVQRTKELDLVESVKFFGYHERPQEIIINADLFILPSLKEGFGLACIEAIQCGLPVIVSSSGGMVEYITDGINGYLFDPRSLDELVQKTEWVMNSDKDKLTVMTTRALETINGLFSPEIYLKELNRIYRLQPKGTQ